MKQVYLKNRDEWRDWLSQNHDKSMGIWLVFYKKHTNLPTLTYQKQFIGWIAAAKTQETRDRRLTESVALLEKGKKLGMK